MKALPTVETVYIDFAFLARYSMPGSRVKYPALAGTSQTQITLHIHMYTSHTTPTFGLQGNRTLFNKTTQFTQVASTNYFE